MKDQVVAAFLLICLFSLEDIGATSSKLHNTGGMSIINHNGPIGNNVGNIGAEPGSYVVYGNGNTGEPASFNSTHRSFHNTGGIGIINHNGAIGKDNGKIGGGANSHVTYDGIEVSGGRPAATSAMEYYVALLLSIAAWKMIP